MHDPPLEGVWSIATSGAGRLGVLAPAVMTVALAWAFHGIAACGGARAHQERSAP